MDENLFRLINSTIKSSLLDRVVPLFSDKDFITIPALFGIGLLFFLSKRRARVIIIAALVGLIVADLTTEKILKNIFDVPRPYVMWQDVYSFRSGQWTHNVPFSGLDARESHAFPSTHAANIAAATVGLAFLYAGTLWIMVPLSLLVGFSRIYVGQHTPGQVLAGFAWGAFCALLATVMIQRTAGRASSLHLVDSEPKLMSAEKKTLLLMLGLWTLANFSFIYLSDYCLTGDEAQYWDWSRHLSLGYYSKPPLIAYVIRMLSQMAGNKEWAIRAGAVFFSAGTLALIYGLTRRIAKSERAGLLAVLVAMGLPANWVGSVLMTVDPPMIFFWTLAMYSFYRAIHGEKNQWLLVGFALGFGTLSKYTILMLLVSLALYLVIVDRRWLRTRWPYLALLVFGVCVSGVVYWNAANGWVSVRHTASIGADNAWSPARGAGFFGQFLGGQFLVVSPLLFVFFVWTAIKLAGRARRNPDAAFLFLCFVTLFGFYALVSFFRKPLPNWPVGAYIALVPALAWMWEQRSRRWLYAALLIGCVMGVMPRTTDFVYMAATPFTTPDNRDRIQLGSMSIDPDKDPTNEMHGGRELGAALTRQLFTETEQADFPFIFSPRYQLTAWAAFYTKGRPHTYCLNYDRRFNQYDLWGGWSQLKGRDALFVTGGDEFRAQAYIDGMVAAGAFSSGELAEKVDIYRGKTRVRSFTISRLHNYSGIMPATSEGKF